MNWNYRPMDKLHDVLDQRVRRYARIAETARLRACLRPGYRVTRLERLKGAFWSHFATRRALVAVAAILAAPSL